jgi:hypothetical protein
MNDNLFLEFKDKPNVDELIKKIKTSRTVGEAVKICQKEYPTWIIGRLERFSPDYDILNRGHQEMCKKVGLEPKGIMIVEGIIVNNDQYKFINTMAELFTQVGTLVRTKTEYTCCSVCGLALPTQYTLNQLQSKYPNLPREFSQTCKKCI